MSTFVELTDFLPKSLENDIYESTMATFMPWYYSDSTIHKGNNTLPSHPDIRDSSQFVHLALWPDQENSWIWNVIKPVLYFFEKEFSSIYIHAYGLIFLIGRLMHSFCFAFTKQNMFLRVGGTVLTLGCILSITIKLLINFF